jgi:hypothetical protein
VLHPGWTYIVGLLFVNLYFYIFNQQRFQAGRAMNSSPAASPACCLLCSEHSKIEAEFVYLVIKSKAMTRQLIIERTVKAINQLPEDKAEEISDFADFVIKRYEEYLLTEGIQKMASKSKTFQFLKDEEELYSIADLKEVYNA